MIHSELERFLQSEIAEMYKNVHINNNLKWNV